MAAEKWVIDLVMHLQQVEDEHPEFFRRLSDDEYVKYDWCPAVALKLVPREVFEAALAVGRYQIEAERDKTPAEGS